MKKATRPGKSGSRRLFFALWPDDGLRIELQRAVRTAVRRAGGRPVPPGSYHLTLAFLGNVPAARVEEIGAASAGVGMPAVVLSLDRFGWFEGPQVFWLGCSEPPPSLAELARALWNAVEPLGLTREKQAFHPHVSLCRKVMRMPDVRPPSPVSWRALDFALVESVTKASGAEYQVLARFPVNGG
jgi:2'-5' RNA ligase